MKKRLVMILCAVALCATMTGCDLLPFAGDLIGTGSSQESSADVSSEQQESGEISFSSKPEELKEKVEEIFGKEEKQGPLKQADLMAQQYDYDGAIELLKGQKDFDSNSEMQEAVKEYESQKAQCVAWPVDKVTHVFYHTLIYDTDKAFDGDSDSGGYNQVMTTVEEFKKITQSMYDKGFVMIRLEDMAKKNEDGVMEVQEIMLPPGKQPFILSQDDVSYYHYMDGDGMASKLVLDENGEVKNEYIEDDGSVSVGDYDMVPLIDSFVKEHPDFSYKGAKGIIALTGYNGVLGYRTDISYKTQPDDLNEDKKKWLQEHPDFKLKKERTAAKKVAAAMKENGWEFASHTWGHLNVGEISLERLKKDTRKWKNNVERVVGETDKIIFAFGADLAGVEGYAGNEKFAYLKKQGFDYYCNVDSSQYWVQITDQYLRQGRRNLDGYRMYYNPDMLSDLFDADEVFDPARPTPVPPM